MRSMVSARRRDLRVSCEGSTFGVVAWSNVGHRYTRAGFGVSLSNWLSMVSMLLDVRQARQRRATLLVLAVSALALPFVAGVRPSLAQWFAPATLTSVLLGCAAWFSAGVCATWSGREARWIRVDDLSWTMTLVAFAGLGATARGPFSVAALLHGVTLVLIGVRVPPLRMVVVGVLSVLLGVLWRLWAGEVLVAYALSMSVAVTAFVFLVRATRSLAWVLAEREGLLEERRARQRKTKHAPRAEVVSPREEIATPRGALTRTAAMQALQAVLTSAGDKDEDGDGGESGSWEALIERIRTSLVERCAAAGVVVTVDAEVKGLVSPGQQLRQQVVKIAQEAVGHAIRDTSTKSVSVSLRRGDGGLVLEVHDDGPEGETLRSRRVLASVRGRVVPLGGSAEVCRAEAGWVVRVKLPCELLN